MGANAYEGDDGRERAQKNLRRFVEAHLVTTSPWVEGKEDGKARTVEGEGKARELWWVQKDGKKIIMPDGVEVDQVASQVANGEVVSLIWSSQRCLSSSDASLMYMYVSSTTPVMLTFLQWILKGVLNYL